MIAALLDGLNPPQRQAVEHRGGPLLVLAGAGSGKTRVITVRIAHLIASGVAPEHVLALTFTNKAAGEMAERVAGIIGEDAARRLTVGTFHSLGLRILDKYGNRLGLPKPLTLIDAGDQSVAIRQCLKLLNLDPRRHDPGRFLMAISNARNAEITPEELGQRSDRRFTAQLYRAYLNWLKAHRAIDFDDLILQPIRLMREHTDVRGELRARFRTILVDEYQDTNAMQLGMVRELSDEHRSLCVVGDDDQSIYGWRGACVANILEFERHFPDATTIALEQNYRSTGHVLASANAVIGVNTARKVKRLWTDIGDGELVKIVACKDPAAEAAWIASEVLRRQQQEERRFSDFGVLFRAGSQARALEDAFRMGGIPYRVVGAFDFYGRKEIKDVLCYLRLAMAPNDRAAFARVVNFPQRGIGPKSLELLLAYAEVNRKNPIAASSAAGQIAGLSAPQRSALQGFATMVDELRKRLRDPGADIAGAAAWICMECGARDAWIRDPTEGPGGETRWKNVEYLMESMRKWQRSNPRATLTEYLRKVTLDARSDREDGETDGVSLMTIHASKGLEWPVCFVVGCQDGVLPHQRTLDDGGDTSEERRLFYVAITRAREVLYLTRARVKRTFHGTEPSRPSRFLSDVPEEHREDIDRARGDVKEERDENKARFAALLAGLGGPPSDG